MSRQMTLSWPFNPYNNKIGSAASGTISHPRPISARVASTLLLAHLAIDRAINIWNVHLNEFLGLKEGFQVTELPVRREDEHERLTD